MEAAGGWAILTRPEANTWKLHALFARPQDAQGYGKNHDLGGRPHLLELPGPVGLRIAEMILTELDASVHEFNRAGYAIVTTPGLGKKIVPAVFAQKADALEFHGLIVEHRNPKVHTLAASVWLAVTKLVVAEAFAFMARREAEVNEVVHDEKAAIAVAERAVAEGAVG